MLTKYTTDNETGNGPGVSQPDSLLEACPASDKTQAGYA